MDFICRKCGKKQYFPNILPSGNYTHKYRLTCNSCDGFVKWGSDKDVKLIQSHRDFLESYSSDDEIPSHLKEFYYKLLDDV